MRIRSVPCGVSVGAGVGEGFGFCAQTITAAALTINAADKYLNNKRVKATDMRYGL
jgi:hypothetical protein